MHLVCTLLILFLLVSRDVKGFFPTKKSREAPLSINLKRNPHRLVGMRVFLAETKSSDI